MLFILLFIISVLFNDKFCITFKVSTKWGLGIGDWGLGIAQSPIPNPLYVLICLFCY